ncbi:MAG: translocation/assembly module TamB domain-containing protein, partial [Sulfurovaceae bacterium]
INAKIRSNIANIDAKIALNDSLSSDAKLKIPQNTLLKNYDSTVNWHLLDNAALQVKRKDKGWDVALQSKALFADLIYSDAALQGKIKIEGKPIANLNIEGAFNLQMSSDKEGKKSLQISSKSLKIGDKKIDQKEIKDITLQIVQKGEGSFAIPAYSLSYKDIPIFAKKPSSFDIKGDQYILKELWINDQALTQGSYDATSQKGSFRLNADAFHLENKFADLSAKIDLIAKLDGKKTDISGSVDILGGELKYSLEQKTFPSDSDIVIIQDIHYKEPSTFVKNLSTNIKIEAKKPIIYKQKNADIIATGNVSINKPENANPLVTGMMTIPKGSSYQFQGKKFILKESHIYFVGEYNKPLLDISADYKSSAYKITVFVSGTPSAPNITFSSRPKLSQQQILAVLLFGSQDAAGTHSGTEMMKMIGGAIAKSALSDAGIKVDHLVLGADTLEVGKKISDKVTIIYVNEEVSKVKVKYNQSRTVEEVLTVSPDSTAIDIYYKKEFEDMGDILYRKKD